jgi:SMODS-associated and fused to various effectors sensor domain
VRREYGNIGTVHLFMVAPAGLAVLVGQLLNTFGAVQTYEHVLTDGSGEYKRAVLLRPGS